MHMTHDHVQPPLPSITLTSLLPGIGW